MNDVNRAKIAYRAAALPMQALTFKDGELEALLASEGFRHKNLLEATIRFRNEVVAIMREPRDAHEKAAG